MYETRNLLVASHSCAAKAQEAAADLLLLLDIYSRRIPLQVNAAEVEGTLKLVEEAQRHLAQVKSAFVSAVQPATVGRTELGR